MRRLYDERSSLVPVLEYGQLRSAAQTIIWVSRKITQTRLAELLGISSRLYNRWENGDVVPHFDTIVRLADLLNVSLDELAGRKEPNGDVHIHNPELHRLYNKVDQLSNEDQKALPIVLTAWSSDPKSAKSWQSFSS